MDFISGMLLVTMVACIFCPPLLLLVLYGLMANAAVWIALARGVAWVARKVAAGCRALGRAACSAAYAASIRRHGYGVWLHSPRMA